MVTEKLTAKQALEEAKAEIQKEDIAKAVKKYKAKLRELSDAQAIVRNIEREIEELEHEINEL